jgi:excisionase family DNA binding protein
MTDEILTTAEAAALLGISASRLRQLAAGGRVRYCQLTARQLLFKRRDLAEITVRKQGRPRKKKEKTQWIKH